MRQTSAASTYAPAGDTYLTAAHVANLPSFDKLTVGDYRVRRVNASFVCCRKQLLPHCLPEAQLPTELTARPRILSTCRWTYSDEPDGVQDATCALQISQAS